IALEQLGIGQSARNQGHLAQAPHDLAHPAARHRLPSVVGIASTLLCLVPAKRISFVAAFVNPARIRRKAKRSKVRCFGVDGKEAVQACTRGNGRVHSMCPTSDGDKKWEVFAKWPFGRGEDGFRYSFLLAPR